MLAYPYGNNKDLDLELKESKEPVYYWLQDDPVDITAVYNYLKDSQHNPPPKVKFKIYQKLFIECGFPKKRRRNDMC